MVKVNGQYWFAVTHTKRLPGGAIQTLAKENGGDVLMTKEINAIHGEGSSKLGVTLNMDNFESLRVDVGVTIPCNVGEEAAAVDEAYTIAEAKLIEKATQFKSKLF